MSKFWAILNKIIFSWLRKCIRNSQTNIQSNTHVTLSKNEIMYLEIWQTNHFDLVKLFWFKKGGHLTVCIQTYERFQWFSNISCNTYNNRKWSIMTVSPKQTKPPDFDRFLDNLSFHLKLLGLPFSLLFSPCVLCSYF